MYEKALELVLCLFILKRDRSFFSYMCVLESNVSALERLCREYKHLWPHKKRLRVFCSEDAVGLNLMWLNLCMIFGATQDAISYTVEGESPVLCFPWGLWRKHGLAGLMRRIRSQSYNYILASCSAFRMNKDKEHKAQIFAPLKED